MAVHDELGITARQLARGLDARYHVTCVNGHVTRERCGDWRATGPLLPWRVLMDQYDLYRTWLVRFPIIAGNFPCAKKLAGSVCGCGTVLCYYGYVAGCRCSNHVQSLLPWQQSLLPWQQLVCDPNNVNRNENKRSEAFYKQSFKTRPYLNQMRDNG